MTQRRFCIRRYDDRGTSLVLALVFITVVSLVVMTVLAFADTSMKSTIALRGQVSETAAAEGAAQVAINALRKGTYNGNSVGCFGATSTLPLNNFYQRPGGSQDSARVTCELDPSLGSAPVVMPQHALLTFDPGNGIFPPIGLIVAGYGSGNSLRVAGAVHSNSTINLLTTPLAGNITASGPITARRGCSGGAGTYSPPPTCNNGVQVSVTYTPNVAGLTDRTVPNCGTTTGVYTLPPGRYTESAKLSALTKSTCHGGNAIVHLLPGTYFFDFPLFSISPPGIGVWAVTAGTVIAGNLRQGVTLTPGVQPALPGVCKSPVPTGAGWVAPEVDDGVTMVFGGNSQLNVTGAGRAEVCGRYAPNALPVAIAAQPTTGTLGLACTVGFPCAAVSTGLVVGAAPVALYVQGTTMLPNREFVVALDGVTQQMFRGGVVARRAGVFSTRSSSAPPVIEVLPSTPSAPRRTVVYLNVFVCPGSSTCSSGGELKLRTKVAFNDPTGLTVAGARQVSVLSWSLQG